MTIYEMMVRGKLCYLISNKLGFYPNDIEPMIDGMLEAGLSYDQLLNIFS